jgi:uncharacterized RDD family membrane protein YckC
MKRFPIIVGIVFLVLGVLVTLSWYRVIHLSGIFYIPHYSPIKEDPYVSFFAHFIIPIIFMALGYGLYLYYKNNSFSLNIISFFYSVVLIDNFYSILTILNEVFFPRKAEPISEMLLIKQASFQDYLPFLVTSVIYFTLSVICLRILVPQLDATINPTKPSKLKMRRLANWIVDVTLISQILFSKLPIIWIKYLSKNESIMMLLISACHTTVYYNLFEIFFRRTPGKFLTNTIVSTTDNSKPSIPTIFLRTLLRLVPLEFISFLFSANWHDRFSKTRVS